MPKAAGGRLRSWRWRTGMDDRPFSNDARRALIPQKQSPMQGKRSPVQLKLECWSRRGKAVFDAIPAPVKTASRHSIWFGSRASAAVAIIALAAIAALYARLLTGPISFAFLAPAVEERLNAQLQGYSFRVGDAILRLADDWGLEFRLANVSLIDENNQEIAKAPLAALDISEPSLLTFSPAASQIDLIGPKVLIFNLPGRGLTLTSPDPPTHPASAWAASQSSLGASLASKPLDEPREIAGVRGMARQALDTEPSAPPFDPTPFLSRLFAAIEQRGGASALQRVGLKDATVYFASDKGVSTWKVADLHVELDDKRGSRALRGEIALQRNEGTWRASFSAINRAREKLYAVTASAQDVVPRALWSSFASFDPMKLVDSPVGGEARFDISHGGKLLNAEAEIELGAGRVFAPFDEKHPAAIDGGLLKVAYDGGSDAIQIKPFTLRWDDSQLTIAGSIAHKTDPRTNQLVWSVDLDGSGTKLGASDFAVQPIAIDSFKIAGAYDAAADSIVLDDFHIQAGSARVAFAGQASTIRSGGVVTLNGTVSPMPLAFLKAIWPAFMASGTREWVGSNVPSGEITGGSLSAQLSAADIAELDNGGDIPDTAVKARLGVSNAKIYHIKGLPPIITKDSTLSINGRRFVYDIPADAHIDVPSGKSIAFSEGQFLVDDIRPEIPGGEIRFKSTGEVAGVLELLDQPPLNYVKAVGFKPSLVSGQAQSAFQIKFPILKDLKFKKMTIAGKSRVFDLKSNGLPAGLSVNGGAVNFDVSESAISANGDAKVNGVPVSIAWQRIFDAPPEKQPTLRLATILNEKGRDELGLNINHIVRGDLPIALAIAMQRDGPPKLFMEANLTNTDLFLTAIGWRKPPGQKAAVTFDLSQRQDGYLALDNFAMTGDGLNINGHLLLNDRHRIAGFNFPEFSTNALTRVSMSGELTPQNVLRVQAKGKSYDGRPFFRSLLNAGKIADNEPAPLKDEPGLDLNAEINTVTGYYDTSIKSVIIDAKRRGGKLTYLEVAGRLNGEAPVAVHVDQRGRDARMLISDATDAGSAFRLVGFYPSIRGGAMNLRVNLDGGGGADKTGVLEVRRFVVTGDEVVGKVITQAEKEGARYKPETRNNAKHISSGEPLQFDRMVVPFSVGGNQFHLHDAAINGPVMGATLRGPIDFAHETIALTGTYVPLYGFNSVLGAFPLIGDLLKGRENEGVFGITYAVQGKTSNPDVVVNPVSMLAPGFLRQIFEFDQAPARQSPQKPSQFGGSG